MTRRITVFVVIILAVWAPLISAQAAPGGNAGSEALSWMVDQAVEMVIRTLSSEGETVIDVGGIELDGHSVVLGDYLAASLPIRLAVRPGHRITVYEEQGRGDFLLAGRLFRVGEGLQLFLSVTDKDGRVLGGRELRLPLSDQIEAMLDYTASGAVGGDRNEPDSLSQPMTARAGEALAGRTISPGGDTDWFKFELDAADESSVLTVFTVGSLDTYIEVYDAADPYQIIAENDDADDENARVSVGINPGQSLIIAVRGYDQSVSGEYQLVSRLEVMPDDPSEPDNSMQEAGSLSVGGSPLTRMIFPTGDQDWYRIMIPAVIGGAGQYLDLKIGGELDSFLELYNAAGDLLIENDDSGGDSNARIFYGPVSAGQILFAKVTQYDDAAVGEYSISAEFAQPRHDRYEPDDQLENAVELELPASGTMEQQRNFSTPSDTDWIKFRLSTPRTVTLTTLGNADTLLSLYENQGVLIEDNDDDGDEYNGRIRRFLAPGIYRLEIRQYEEDAQLGMEYRLQITVE